MIQRTVLPLLCSTLLLCGWDGAQAQANLTRGTSPSVPAAATSAWSSSTSSDGWFGSYTVFRLFGAHGESAGVLWNKMVSATALQDLGPVEGRRAGAMVWVGVVPMSGSYVSGSFQKQLSGVGSSYALWSDAHVGTSDETVSFAQPVYSIKFRASCDKKTHHCTHPASQDQSPSRTALEPGSLMTQVRFFNDGQAVVDWMWSDSALAASHTESSAFARRSEKARHTVLLDAEHALVLAEADGSGLRVSVFSPSALTHRP